MMIVMLAIVCRFATVIYEKSPMGSKEKGVLGRKFRSLKIVISALVGFVEWKMALWLKEHVFHTGLAISTKRIFIN